MLFLNKAIPETYPQQKFGYTQGCSDENVQHFLRQVSIQGWEQEQGGGNSGNECTAAGHFWGKVAERDRREEGRFFSCFFNNR